MKKCIVGGCVVMHNGRMLMLKHRKLGVWLYPGGHLEQNETPIDTALRETAEETGLKVRIVDVSKGNKILSDGFAKETPTPLAVMLERVPYKNRMHLHFDLVYLAVPKNSSRVKIMKQEAEGFRWLTRRELSRIKTYENVRKVGMRAFDHAKAF